MLKCLCKFQLVALFLSGKDQLHWQSTFSDMYFLTFKFGILENYILEEGNISIVENLSSFATHQDKIGTRYKGELFFISPGGHHLLLVVLPAELVG